MTGLFCGTNFMVSDAAAFDCDLRCENRCEDSDVTTWCWKGLPRNEPRHNEFRLTCTFAAQLDEKTYT
jgi:hypothetical protein